MSEDIQRALNLIEKAQAMTGQLRASDSEDHLLAYAEQQLGVMSRILREGRSPTDSEKHQINVGLMAIRELEGGPLDDYAVALEEASGAFHGL